MTYLVGHWQIFGALRLEVRDVATLPTERIAWTYTADDGTNYRVAANEALTSQAKLGGTAWNGTDGPKPADIKMRRISLSNTAGQSRVVPVYSVGAPIATAGATLDVNILLVQTTLSSSGNPIPQGHLRQSVTKRAS